MVRRLLERRWEFVPALPATVDDVPVSEGPVVIRLRAPRPAPAGGDPSSEPVPSKDRRIHRRHTLAELPWLDVVRIKYGPTLTLIDLSPGGAQFETEGHRLQPNSTIVVQFGSQGGLAVPANVLRCQIRGFSPHPIYRGAVAFTQPIEISRDLLTPAPAALDPVREHARLVDVFHRWAAALGVPSASPSGDGLTAIDDDELAVALTALEAARDPDHAAPLRDALTGLFKTVAVCCERLDDADAVAARILDHAWRIVPSRATRPWHQHYLTATAHLAASVRRAGLLAAAARPAPAGAVATAAAPTAEAAGALHGWNRVVVRFADGQVVKGYSREFTAASSHLSVWPEPRATDAGRSEVPLDQVKAVFFVRDFAGTPEYVEDPDAPATRHGRRIAVTFADGETLVGTTLNYSAASRGFFLHPVDDRSNNIRVFVAKAFVKKVRFC
jgi:hypothetical protein